MREMAACKGPLSYPARYDDPTCIEVKLDCNGKKPIVSWHLTPLTAEKVGVFHCGGGSTINIGDISEVLMMYARVHHSILKGGAAGPL